MAKAFTLIELLIVLVIIGILVTLALPQYKMFLYRSQAAEAKQTLRALVDSAWMYRQETGRWPGGTRMYGPIPADIDLKLSGSKYFKYQYAVDVGNDQCYFDAERLDSDSLVASGKAGIPVFYTVEFLYAPTTSTSNWPNGTYFFMSKDWYVLMSYSYTTGTGSRGSSMGWPP